MHARVLALTLILTLIFNVALAQDSGLELAFCVPIANYPMSDRERGGFDIEIAQLLANELGATATFTWTNFDDIGIRDTLHAGVCDVAIGITEGLESVMTTVAYLNAPYAFVTLEDSDISIDSLDDPQLQVLRIGTYQTGLPSIALRNRGIRDNVIEYAARLRPTGVDRDTPILDALEAGEVDVAIVYGPAAAARSLASDATLVVEALTPEVDFGPTLIPMTRILALGVRQHDEALRDVLNRAMARRWDDVNAVLDAYEIPRFGVPRPVDVGELAGARKVGVMLSASTPASLPNAQVGDDALRGASVAENSVAVKGSSSDPFLVLTAHTPTVEALQRAALRLVLVDEVDALVGGYEPEEARVIARIAAQHGVPFFNVGSEDDGLRDAFCYPTTFHVAPSTSMMLDAVVSSAVGNGLVDMFVVAEQGTGAEDYIERLADLATAAGGSVVGAVLVEPAQFVYYPLLEQIEAAAPDSTLLLLSSDSQEILLSQAAPLELTTEFRGVSPVRGQSRPYLQRFLQVAPMLAAQPRVVAWDPAVALPLNETFAFRTGEPMEPVAWTTYAAIDIAFQAAQNGSLDTLDGLRTYVSDTSVGLDVGKEEPVTFRLSDGQMLQELYVIETAPHAAWGRTAAVRIALADVVEVIPAAVTADSGLSMAGHCEAP